ncbi:MAG: hypothetical protein RLZZ28_1180 [Bacteroidota bacterium]|jgi:hypothetical protein
MKKTITFFLSLLALVPLIVYAFWPETEDLK